MTKHCGQNVPATLALQGITKSYPGVQALRDVSFAANSGEVHALLGENGAGKSTLLKILSGAIRPDGGTILLDGQRLDVHSPLQARHAGIALIHQELALVPQMNAVRNIFLGRELRRDGVRLDRTMMERRAREVVDRLGLDIDLKRPVRTLSMAQRQCIEIARALLSSVRVLALDEPTSSLTNRERDRLFDVLRQLRGEGVAIVYVSHRLEELAEIADRATIMRDGAVVDTVRIGETPRSRLVSMMVGRDLSEYPEPAFRTPGKVALRVQHVSADSGIFDISLDAYRGQVLGIAGLIGSGRTELLRVIFGADPMRNGSIEVNGEAFEPGVVRGAIRRRIGLLPEDRKGQALFARMSIRSNMTLASLERFTRAGVLRERERDLEANRLIEDLDLRPRDANRHVGVLSGGNQQKAIVGRWLSAKSDILLIDEPTRGVDVGAKAEIYRIIESRAKAGAAVIMVSSDLPEILQMSDRIAVMRAGRLAKELTRGEATEVNIMHFATGGA